MEKGGDGVEGNYLSVRATQDKTEEGENLLCTCFHFLLPPTPPLTGSIQTETVGRAYVMNDFNLGIALWNSVVSYVLCREGMLRNVVGIYIHIVEFYPEL